MRDKIEVVALSQSDAEDADTLRDKSKALKKVAGTKPIHLSSATRTNVDETLRALMEHIEEAREAEREPTEDEKRFAKPLPEIDPRENVFDDEEDALY